jgi:phytoene synthase
MITTGAEREAVRAADAQLTAKGRSFHWARRLLEAHHAERATRLYGLCRHLDDLADEAPSAAWAKTKLAEAVSEIRAGKSLNPVLQDGILLMQECNIPGSVVIELITGLSSDLDPVAMDDVDSLLRYCYRVAGTVGVMMCGVLDVREKRAFAHAIDLGIGMQLTNICRDVSEDATLGRRYLPATMTGDIPLEELIHPAPQRQPQVRKCTADLLALADFYYVSGENGLSYLPFRARSAILVAARVYRAIGTGLKNRDFDYWSGRVVVPDQQKIIVTARALASVPFHRGFWAQPCRHDSQLHQALIGLPFVEESDADD